MPTQLLVFLFLILVSSIDIGFALDKQDLTREIDGIFATIETNYAPLILKSETVSLDWLKTKNYYRLQVSTITNLKEYYRLIANLFGELKDAHVSVSLPSSRTAVLPIQFVFRDGKTVLGFINRSALPKETFAANPGDILISMDGKKPDEIRQDLAKSHGIGNDSSDAALLTLYLTRRSEERGFPIPSEDKATIILSDANGDEKKYILNWIFDGLEIIDHPVERRHFGLFQNNSSLNRSNSDFSLDSFGQGFVERYRKTLAAMNRLNGTFSLLAGGAIDGLDNTVITSTDRDGEGIPTTLGASKPFFSLPENFQVFQPPKVMAPILDASGLFAGVFQHEGKRVGFLRIPSYMPADSKQWLYVLLSIRYYINRLEQETDLLFLDQSNNPGGTVTYADWLISSLTTGDYSFKQMRFAVKPTHSWMRGFAEMLLELEKAEAEYQEILSPERLAYYKAAYKEIYNTIHKAYIENRPLSAPISLTIFSEFFEEVSEGALKQLLAKTGGIFNLPLKMFLKTDVFKKTPYSKKIIMLINELDFSGGDYTPAVLQDNGRVLMIGKNTAGAGGSVNAYENKQKNEFGFRLTESLMVRPSGKFVENFGITPQIMIEPSIDDVKDNYTTYFARILKATW